MPENDPGRLYEAHAERVRRFLLARTGEPELSADILQECFARLIVRLRDGVPDNVLAYLYTVATHLLIDHRRNHQQSRTASVPIEDLHDIHDAAPGPDATAETAHRLRTLRKAMAELPVRTRHVFQLCRLQHMTYPQAARHLGISVSSVQKHLALALRFITETLNAPERDA
ncbi:RNA polymerase sigma-70 factor (ECF subfamily) [Luteibacter sp. Sphag1AF]|uniref:sigma-70 family RNA polymerase sigma factor n=1 Tax=Luteibacter sp. Sphag1AF TaxID=2587031 RepID=UPI00180B93EA|nr:RNA polymerase sigma-70 factor (ECF subfamily) [Luteibacter sp. Sphag1AF]